MNVCNVCYLVYVCVLRMYEWMYVPTCVCTYVCYAMLCCDMLGYARLCPHVLFFRYVMFVVYVMCVRYVMSVRNVCNVCM